jgi:hypothetical protein
MMKMTQTIHESYSRNETVIGGSDRSFGIVMTAAFAVIRCSIGGMKAVRGAGRVESRSFSLRRHCFILPQLKPLNQLWLKFGLLPYKVVNPIVMALVFFGTVLPTGLIMRALGKDPLRLKRRTRRADRLYTRRRLRLLYGQ